MTADIIFVGGGLAAGLCALRLKQHRPEWDVVILEQAGRLGGDHTWCFHGSDLNSPLDDPSQAWLQQLITRSWDNHDVFFPGFHRRLPGQYHSIRSPDFAAECQKTLGQKARTNTTVKALSPLKVTLADGSKLSATTVIDARGFAQFDASGYAYQKFVGLFLTTEKPHGLKRPVIMDARLCQTDGYRFVYTLPFCHRTLLIEDTRYADTPHLDVATLHQGILDYAQTMGWQVAQVDQKEQGVLPLPLTAAKRPRAQPGQAAKIGVAGGLFNAATGYSLGEAIHFAEWLCGQPKGQNLTAAIEDYADQVWAKETFGRKLNAMLFAATPSHRRVAVMERFYRHPPDLIQRFYGGKLSWQDKLKILAIKPPIPLWPALQSFCWPQEVQA